MTENAPQPINRTQRVLAVMVVTIIGLSLAAFAAILIASALGVTAGGFSEGVWPVIATVPLVGLPIAFVLLIILIISTAVSRRRQAAS